MPVAVSNRRSTVPSKTKPNRDAQKPWPILMRKIVLRSAATNPETAPTASDAVREQVYTSRYQISQSSNPCSPRRGRCTEQRGPDAPRRERNLPPDHVRLGQ